MRKMLVVIFCFASLCLTSRLFADRGAGFESGSYKTVRSAYRENIGLQHSSPLNLAVGLSSAGAPKTASLKKNYSPSPNAEKSIAPQRAGVQAQSRLSNFWSDTVPVVIGPLGAIVAVAGVVILFTYSTSLGLGLIAAGLVLVAISGAVAPM